MAAIGLAIVGSALILMNGTDTQASATAPRTLPMPSPISGAMGAPPTNTPPLSGAPALAAQPPGPAPDGKVWSPEHGHWHDAPGASPAITPGASGDLVSIPSPVGAGTPTAEPPGPAPEGKVWSAEHGHWHDAPGAAPQITPGAPEANGEIVTIPQPVDAGTPKPELPAPPPSGTSDPK